MTDTMTELLNVPTASLVHDNYRDLDTAHVARIAANMASDIEDIINLIKF